MDWDTSYGRFRVSLLTFAWALFLASMCLPAFHNVPPFTAFVGLGYVPMGVLAFGIIAMPLWKPLSWITPASISIALFLLTPLLTAFQRRFDILIRMVAVGLLGAWVLPIAMINLISPQDAFRQEIGHLAWGYYVMAISHTIAFIAIEFCGKRSERRRRLSIVLANRSAPDNT